MVSEPCEKCKNDIGDDDCFECDACTRQYHLLCDNVRKGDVTARATSKNLKLYCTRCMSHKLEIANAEKLSIIFKYVSKIDLQTQKQVAIQAEAADKLDKIVADAVVVKEKMDDIKSCIGAGVNVGGGTNTYANVVRAATKPTVIIKPKNVTQNATATSDDIRKEISSRDVNACGLRKLHGGSVVISCESGAASMKMKTMVEAKFGDKYDVSLPDIMKPRMRIFRVDGVNENDIVDELKQRNEWLVNGDIVVKKIIKSKNEKYNDFDVIIEVDLDSFDKLTDAGCVNLGWKSCKVAHHIHLTRCFKCCGFGHIAERCSNKLACAKCSGEHKTAECKSNETRCVNCKVMNEKFGTKLNTRHRPWHSSCDVLKKRTERFAKNFVTKKSQ